MIPPVPERPALFLDFDGTLVDIVDRPDGVTVAHDLPAVIDALARVTGGAVAVVTGRKIEDVDRHLSLPIAAAGMHGLERRLAPGDAVSNAPPPEEIQTLRERILAWPGLGGGVSMEDKGAGLALHYRAAPERESEVKTAMTRLARDLETLHLIAGKMVVEAKGKGFDKGVAVDAFMAGPPFHGRTPVFVGDDVTDEDGIRAVEAAGGFGIKVGDGPTLATYRLPDVAAVHTWLRTVAQMTP
ncbi:MAG: trehalose-phosphatase [Pseudomonadota bacterium]